MTEHDMFCNELDSLIHRWRKECTTLALGDIIAALEMKKQVMICEAISRKAELDD